MPESRICLKLYWGRSLPVGIDMMQREGAAQWQIDALVYELYGLTEEEIGAVESLSR
jgi:hypothetical protein